MNYTCTHSLFSILIDRSLFVFSFNESDICEVSKCHHNATCGKETNYQCVCHEDFQGNGTFCEGTEIYTSLPLGGIFGIMFFFVLWSLVSPERSPDKEKFRYSREIPSSEKPAFKSLHCIIMHSINSNWICFNYVRSMCCCKLPRTRHVQQGDQLWLRV